MKKISLFIMLLFVILLIPIESKAAYDYNIKSYDIKIIVNEDNTMDITETIGAYFSYNKHGIYRKIPLKNEVVRNDGTKSSNRAVISNIEVSDEFTTSNEGGYKVIKIGDANKYVRGDKTYTISYKYNLGKDPVKDYDELYFNLIGTEWDTSISNITFSITMPKSFDKSKLGFSSGSQSTVGSQNVTYTVNGNTITGQYNGTLSMYQGITVRLELPEGYFVGASSNFDGIALLFALIPVIFALICYFLWNAHGKDDKVIETVEFYPPEGCNSADVAFMYKGHSESKDIVSLLVYLANKGYLRIEEYEEKKSIGKSKSFKLVKLKEYDGTDENERLFFDGLFGIKNEVTKSDLYNKFYVVLKSIARSINIKENKEKIFEKDSMGKKIIVLAMILITFLSMGGLNILQLGDVRGIFWILFGLGFGLFTLYVKPSKTAGILTSIGLVLLSFMFNYEEVFMGTMYVIFYIIKNICMVAMIIFLAIMQKRTPYGTEMLGKIKGFKYFLEVAEKPQLEALVAENPEYFYNILPYTYVLGVSKVWMKKFEDIALEAPTWYYGTSRFNTVTFNHFMNTTYASATSAMSSSPSSSGGGGSSGGGSGGGGGGSW